MTAFFIFKPGLFVLLFDELIDGILDLNIPEVLQRGQAQVGQLPKGFENGWQLSRGFRRVRRVRELAHQQIVEHLARGLDFEIERFEFGIVCGHHPRLHIALDDQLRERADERGRDFQLGRGLDLHV